MYSVHFWRQTWEHHETWKSSFGTLEQAIPSKPSIVGFHRGSMLVFVGVMYGIFIFPQFGETAELLSIGASMLSEPIWTSRFSLPNWLLNQNGNGDRLQKGESNKYKKVSKVMGSSLRLFEMCCIIRYDFQMQIYSTHRDYTAPRVPFVCFSSLGYRWDLPFRSGLCSLHSSHHPFGLGLACVTWEPMWIRIVCLDDVEILVILACEAEVVAI